MINYLESAINEAYASACASIAAEGRRILGVSARLDTDGSFTTPDGSRFMLTFDTEPILSTRDALQASAERRAR